MGRGKASSTSEKAPKPKTAIQIKREERRLKKSLPQPPRLPLPLKEPKEPKEPREKRPKPKPQNPGFQKWAALFKRELIVIETHIKHAMRFQDHWRAEIDKMEPEERARWESGEIGNWVRLQKNLERSREILVLAREANAWIVPPNKLGLKKQGLGMKDLKFEGGKTEETKEDTESSSGERDEDEDAEIADSSVPAPAEFVPLNIGKQTSQAETSTAKAPVEPNPYFVVDPKPTPVNVNGAGKEDKKRARDCDYTTPKATKKSKKRQENEETATEPAVPESKKRSSPDAEEDAPQAKKSKKQDVIAPVPEDQAKEAPKAEHKPKASRVDLSSIETQLQAEIEAGLKAKEERAAAKLAKKEKKRKRTSEGSEKESKKSRKDLETKTKRKAGDGVEDGDAGKKKSKLSA